MRSAGIAPSPSTALSATRDTRKGSVRCVWNDTQRSCKPPTVD
jgi:hypothetical protein